MAGNSSKRLAEDFTGLHQSWLETIISFLEECRGPDAQLVGMKPECFLILCERFFLSSLWFLFLGRNKMFHCDFVNYFDIMD